MGGREEEQCAVRALVDLMSTCFTHQRPPTSLLFPFSKRPGTSAGTWDPRVAYFSVIKSIRQPGGRLVTAESDGTEGKRE